MNFLNQLEFSLSGNFNSNDVLGKVKMFDQIASMTEEAKQEAIKKRMDYERRRSVFEKRKISSSSSTMQQSSRGQNQGNFSLIKMYIVHVILRSLMTHKQSKNHPNYVPWCLGVLDFSYHLSVSIYMLLTAQSFSYMCTIISEEDVIKLPCLRFISC